MREGVAARLRTEFEAAGLVEEAMSADPFTEFASWFEGVLEAEMGQPNAFVLATATPDGSPSARAVLMKDFSPEGITFYTNLESRKSRDINYNPRAAATFVWIPLHRQVRFEGTVLQVAPDEADAYWMTRPRGAQVAAHASPQSTVVDSRDVLEQGFAEVDSTHAGETIPRPANWGGWRLVPETVEFWQGQPNRFHDRVLYRSADGVWRKERLAP